MCASHVYLVSMEAGGELFAETALLYQNKGVSAACYSRTAEEKQGLGFKLSFVQTASHLGRKRPTSRLNAGIGGRGRQTLEGSVLNLRSGWSLASDDIGTSLLMFPELSSNHCL